MRMLVLIFLSLVCLALATPAADPEEYGRHEMGGGSYGLGQGLREGMGQMAHMGEGALEGVMEGVHGLGQMGMGYGGMSINALAQQYSLALEDLRYFAEKGIFPLPSGGCTCPPRLHHGRHRGEMGGMGGMEEIGGYGMGEHNMGGYQMGEMGGYRNPAMGVRGSFGDDAKSDVKPPEKEEV